MNEREALRVEHMLRSAAEALSFVQGQTFEEFATSRRTILAVVKSLEVIGEAATHLSDETRSRFEGVSWPVIITMRHQLVHAYFDINLQIVWDTVHDDLPTLVDALRAGMAIDDGPKEQA